MADIAKLEPALSPDEWREILFAFDRERLSKAMADAIRDDRPAAAIAVLNDLLPDDDRRKITRERVDAMRYAGRALRQALRREYGRPDSWGDVPAAYDRYGVELERFADALESYLSPP